MTHIHQFPSFASFLSPQQLEVLGVSSMSKHFSQKLDQLNNATNLSLFNERHDDPTGKTTPISTTNRSIGGIVGDDSGRGKNSINMNVNKHNRCATPINGPTIVTLPRSPISSPHGNTHGLDIGIDDVDSPITKNSQNSDFFGYENGKNNKNSAKNSNKNKNDGKNATDPNSKQLYLQEQAQLGQYDVAKSNNVPPPPPPSTTNKAQKGGAKEDDNSNKNDQDSELESGLWYTNYLLTLQSIRSKNCIHCKVQYENDISIRQNKIATETAEKPVEKPQTKTPPLHTTLHNTPSYTKPFSPLTHTNTTASRYLLSSLSTFPPTQSTIEELYATLHDLLNSNSTIFSMIPIVTSLIELHIFFITNPNITDRSLDLIFTNATQQRCQATLLRLIALLPSISNQYLIKAIMTLLTFFISSSGNMVVKLQATQLELETSLYERLPALLSVQNPPPEVTNWLERYFNSIGQYYNPAAQMTKRGHREKKIVDPAVSSFLDLIAALSNTQDEIDSLHQYSKSLISTLLSSLSFGGAKFTHPYVLITFLFQHVCLKMASLHDDLTLCKDSLLVIEGNNISTDKSNNPLDLNQPYDLLMSSISTISMSEIDKKKSGQKDKWNLISQNINELKDKFGPFYSNLSSMVKFLLGTPLYWTDDIGTDGERVDNFDFKNEKINDKSDKSDKNDKNDKSDKNQNFSPQICDIISPEFDMIYTSHIETNLTQIEQSLPQELSIMNSNDNNSTPDQFIQSISSDLSRFYLSSDIIDHNTFTKDSTKLIKSTKKTTQNDPQSRFSTKPSQQLIAEIYGYNHYDTHLDPIQLGASITTKEISTQIFSQLSNQPASKNDFSPNQSQHPTHSFHNSLSSLLQSRNKIPVFSFGLYQLSFSLPIEDLVEILTLFCIISTDINYLSRPKQGNNGDIQQGLFGDKIDQNVAKRADFVQYLSPFLTSDQSQTHSAIVNSEVFKLAMPLFVKLLRESLKLSSIPELDVLVEIFKRGYF